MTFSKEIIEILDYIGHKFGIAIDWSSDNVLPYVRQLCEKYISFEMATSIAWLVFGIILIIIGLLCIKADWDGLQWIVIVMLCMIGMTMIGVQVYDIIACNTFPELKIIEFIKRHYQ